MGECYGCEKECIDITFFGAQLCADCAALIFSSFEEDEIEEST